MHLEPDSLPTGHAGIAARLKKCPTIHSSAWIVPGATVIGDVILEEESSVWYGAVLRYPSRRCGSRGALDHRRKRSCHNRD
jgi:hypothetical protein